MNFQTWAAGPYAGPGMGQNVGASGEPSSFDAQSGIPGIYRNGIFFPMNPASFGGNQFSPNPGNNNINQGISPSSSTAAAQGTESSPQGMAAPNYAYPPQQQQQPNQILAKRVDELEHTLNFFLRQNHSAAGTPSVDEIKGYVDNRLEEMASKLSADVKENREKTLSLEGIVADIKKRLEEVEGCLYSRKPEGEDEKGSYGLIDRVCDVEEELYGAENYSGVQQRLEEVCVAVFGSNENKGQGEEGKQQQPGLCDRFNSFCDDMYSSECGMHKLRSDVGELLLAVFGNQQTLPGLCVRLGMVECALRGFNNGDPKVIALAAQAEGLMTSNGGVYQQVYKLGAELRGNLETAQRKAGELESITEDLRKAVKELEFQREVTNTRINSALSSSSSSRADSSVYEKLRTEMLQVRLDYFFAECMYMHTFTHLHSHAFVTCLCFSHLLTLIN